MDDQAETVQLTLTPDEVDILKRALRNHFNKLMRDSDRFTKNTGESPALYKSREAKALLRRIEALGAEDGEDAG